MDASDTIIYVCQKAQTVPGKGKATPVGRTPTQCHIDLACNTSYHFAASRTVFHGVALPLPGTVCAFWHTYMIVSLASIW